MQALPACVCGFVVLQQKHDSISVTSTIIYSTNVCILS